MAGPSTAFFPPMPLLHPAQCHVALAQPCAPFATPSPSTTAWHSSRVQNARCPFPTAPVQAQGNSTLARCGIAAADVASALLGVSQLPGAAVPERATGHAAHSPPATSSRAARNEHTVVPLLGAAGAATAHRRGVLPALYTTAKAGLGLAVAAGVGLLVRAGLRADDAATEPPSIEQDAGGASTPPTTAPIRATVAPSAIALDRLEQLEAEIVALPDGRWASAWDVLSQSNDTAAPALFHDDPSLAPRRLHREVAGDTDRMLDREQVSSRHAMEEALVLHFARQPGLAWLTQLSPNEQRLWLTHHIRLEQMQQQWADAAQTDAGRLDAALKAAGWVGEWQDISVHPAATQWQNQTLADDTLPLLEYCLFRASTAGEVRFSRNQNAIGTRQQKLLGDFVASNACTALAAQSLALPTVDATLVATLQAQFTAAALRAKANKTLGSGGGAYLRGAEIVLAFIKGSAHVEHGHVLYTGLVDADAQLDDGRPAASFHLPNYLVIRSRASDPDAHRRGQVVLYRADDELLMAFANDTEFRQYIEARNADFDPSLSGAVSEDAQAAAPDGASFILQGLHGAAAYPGRPAEWSQRNHLQLVFTQPAKGVSAFDDWATQAADALVNNAATRALRHFEQQQQRWSPVGVKAAQAVDRMEKALSAVQGWTDHARPAVFAMANAIHEQLLTPDSDRTVLLGDHHRVELTCTPTAKAKPRSGDLAFWATHGWARDGLQSDGKGRFGEDTAAKTLKISVYERTADGNERVDTEATDLMNRPVYLINLCYRLRDLEDDTTLLDAYKKYLHGFATTPAGAQFKQALGEGLRWRAAALLQPGAAASAWMDAPTRERALAQHGHLGTPRAPLQVVTLNGHPVDRLWQMGRGESAFIFLFDGPDGDRVMTQAQFLRFVRDDRVRAEPYLRQRTGYAHHREVATALGSARVADGLVVGERFVGSFDQAAHDWLQTLADNAGFLKRQHASDISNWLPMVAGFAVAGTCMVATGGLGAALCAGGTAAFVIRGFREAGQALEQGDARAAIAGMFGAGAGGFGMLAPPAVARLLFHVGRRSVTTAAEASEAAVEWMGQAVAFDGSGLLIAGLALPPSMKPLLKARRSGGAGIELTRDGRTYVRTAHGDLVETYRDERGTHRLVDGRSPGAVGPPIAYSQGGWRRADEPPAHWFIRTTPKPAVTLTQAQSAVAELPDASRQHLTKVFGLGDPRMTITPDLRRNVEHAWIDARIDEMIQSPQEMGLRQDMPALLTAWCHSALGQQRGIRLYTPATRKLDFQQGPLFGFTEGLHVPLRQGQCLPKLHDVVAAQGHAEVAQLLGLAPGTAPGELMAAVREELARTLVAKRPIVAAAWRNWEDRTQVPSPTTDSLMQHFPLLTHQEAHHLTAHVPRMKEAADSWHYDAGHEKSVARVLAQRRSREIRERLLDGQLRQLDEVQALQSHLRDLLPGRNWVVSGGGAEPVVLEFGRSGTTGVPRMRVDREGRMRSIGPDGGSGVACPSWQECVHPQLSEDEKKLLPEPSSLKQRVGERMSNQQVDAVCRTWPARAGFRLRQRRALDHTSCPLPPVGRRISVDEKSTMDAVQRAHGQESLTFWTAVNEKAAAKEISKAVASHLPSSNMVSWRIEELTVRNEAVDLTGLGKTGAALSGSFPLQDMLPGIGPRTVFYPADTPAGAIRRSEVFPERYAFGGDADPVAPGGQGGQATSPDTFKVEQADLDHMLRKGNPRSFKELTEQDVLAATPMQVPGKFRKFFGAGKDHPLPESIATLEAGKTYRAYRIRSCSEGKWLDQLFTTLSRVDETLVADLRRGIARPEVKGRIFLFSDMDPCKTSCDRRLAKMQALLPNVRLNLQYRFKDAAHRNAEKQAWVDRAYGKWMETCKSDGTCTDTIAPAVEKQKKTELAASWYADAQYAAETPGTAPAHAYVWRPAAVNENDPT